MVNSGLRSGYGLVGLGALLVVAACSDTPSAAEPRDPTPELREIALLDSIQWGGGVVRARSAGFVPGLPLVLAGAETLSVGRVDPVTVAIRMPGGPSGPLPLSAVLGADTIAIGSVQLYSIAESRAIEPLKQTLLPWQVDGVPHVLGESYQLIGPTGGGLADVDLRSGAATIYPDLRTLSPYGPSFSAVTGQIILPDTIGLDLNSYDLWPTPTLTGPARATGTRHVLQVSDSVWVVTAHHDTYAWAFQDSVITYYRYEMESPWVAAVARTAGRLVFVHNGSFTGTPVIDTETGDTAYMLSALRSTRAAAFSTDESTLYLVGRFVGGGDSLVALASLDGSRQQGVATPSGLVLDWLVVDPDRPYLYLAAYSYSGTTGALQSSVVLVYSTPTLELVGQLDGSFAPTRCSLTGYSSNYWSTAAIDVSLRKLHLIVAGNPSCQEIFDLMP